MRCAGCDALDGAVSPEQGKLETSCAVAARGEREFKPCGKPLDGRKHVLLACDRLMKALLRDIRRDRQTWRERFIFTTKGAVELAQEIGPETGNERRARQIENVADAFQAKTRQRGNRLMRQPQRS